MDMHALRGPRLSSKAARSGDRLDRVCSTPESDFLERIAKVTWSRFEGLPPNWEATLLPSWQELARRCNRTG